MTAGCPEALTSKASGPSGSICSSSGMMWGRQKALSMLQSAGFEVEARPAEGFKILSIGMLNQQGMVRRNINWVTLPSEEEIFTLGQ